MTKNFGVKDKKIDITMGAIDDKSPNYKTISSALEQGLVKGKGNNNFDLEADITRQEAETIIARALQQYGRVKSPTDVDKVLASYVDKDKIASWAKDNIALVKNKGLSASKNNSYSPTENINKKEAASLIYNVNKNL